MADVALWTAVAAAAGAVAASGITAFVTYKLTNRQIENAQDEGEKQRQHELELAKDDRNQERLAKAYLVLTQYVQYHSQLARETTIRAQSDTGGPMPPPDIDDSAQATASLMASGEVGGLLQTFDACLHDFQMKWNAYMVANQRDDVRHAQIRRDSAVEENEALQGVGDDLIEKMREELGAVGRLLRTVG